MKKDEAKQKIDEGLETLASALDAGRSEELTRYLAVMGRLHRYSFGNVMLILIQFPEASHVAGFHKWLELGRHVKKGEKGIGIIAPMRYRKKDDDDENDGTDIRGFKIVHVFDYSQTDGEDLPEFAGIKGDAGEHLSRLEAVIAKHGIQLVEGMLPPDTLGTSSGGKITLRPGLSPTERLSIALHEFAHENLHHGSNRGETTKTVRECEAEATAAVVLGALGLDSSTRSSDYIQLYRGDTTTLAESLEVIQKTALFILDEMENVAVEENARCNHTVHLDDAGSTWIGIEVKGGTRYECSVCQHFYGFDPTPVAESELVVVAADGKEEASEEPELRIGRADYEERRGESIERFRNRAATARAESDAAYEDSSRMASAIPFGQPILVGHHSEQRDRNFRKRMQNKMSKSVELGKKARHYDSRADSAEEHRSISSDDPQALVRLCEKLARAEALQARMKSVNAAWRRAGKPEADNVEAWKAVANELGIELDELGHVRVGFAQRQSWSGKAPYENYELLNNNAEIRRIKQRIAELEREGQVTDTTEVDHGFCHVVENVDVNRVQIVFPGKPEEAVRAVLKQNGFRWARSEGAWQRQLNDAGRRAATYVLSQLEKEQNDAEHERESSS